MSKVLPERSFVAVGVDAQVADAFDDAITTAWYEVGHSGLTPSIADLDVDSVEQLSLAPSSRARAELLARRALAAGTLPDGSVLVPGRSYALAVAPDAQFKRVKVSVQATDPALDLPDAPGALLSISPELEAELHTLAMAKAAPPADALLESVEMLRLRRRYKPQVTAFKGRNRSEYQVSIRESGEVVSTHPSASEARRAAIALAREGVINGREGYTLEVSIAARREDGSPLLEVVRARITQVAALKLAYTTVKNPAKCQTHSWVFFGIVPPATELTPGDSDSDTPEESAATE